MATKKSTQKKKVNVDAFAKKVKYKEGGLAPAIVQDYHSNAVLMLAYMSDESLRMTLKTGKMTYWSRSRQELWIKGNTSGSFQLVKEVYLDCDNDTLLFKVDQKGSGACHTGEYTCFFQKAEGGKRKTIDEKYYNMIQTLYTIVKEQKRSLPDDSYIAEMLKSGTDNLLSGLVKSAGDSVISMKNKKQRDIINSVADLWFHSLLLLANYDIEPLDVNKELHGRTF